MLTSGRVFVVSHHGHRVALSRVDVSLKLFMFHRRMSRPCLFCSLDVRGCFSLSPCEFIQRKKGNISRWSFQNWVCISVRVHWSARQYIHWEVWMLGQFTRAVEPLHQPFSLPHTDSPPFCFNERTCSVNFGLMQRRNKSALTSLARCLNQRVLSSPRLYWNLRILRSWRFSDSSESLDVEKGNT